MTYNLLRNVSKIYEIDAFRRRVIQVSDTQQLLLLEREVGDAKISNMVSKTLKERQRVIAITNTEERLMSFPFFANRKDCTKPDSAGHPDMDIDSEVTVPRLETVLFCGDVKMDDIKKLRALTYLSSEGLKKLTDDANITVVQWGSAEPWMTGMLAELKKNFKVLYTVLNDLPDQSQTDRSNPDQLILQSKEKMYVEVETEAAVHHSVVLRDAFALSSPVHGQALQTPVNYAELQQIVKWMESPSDTLLKSYEFSDEERRILEAMTSADFARMLSAAFELQFTLLEKGFGRYVAHRLKDLGRDVTVRFMTGPL